MRLIASASSIRMLISSAAEFCASAAAAANTARRIPQTASMILFGIEPSQCCMHLLMDRRRGSIGGALSFQSLDVPIGVGPGAAESPDRKWQKPGYDRSRSDAD